MKSGLKSWKDFHHRINLVYHAVIAISLVPFALVFLEIDSGISRESQIDGSFQWVVILLLLATTAAVCVVVWRNAKTKIGQIDKSLEIKPRIAQYFNLQIRRYFQLEAAAVVSLAGLWLTSSYIFVVAYLLVLVQFSLLRPSQDKLIRDLQFSKEEREMLRNPEF